MKCRRLLWTLAIEIALTFARPIAALTPSWVPTTPHSRALHSAVFDPGTNRMIVFAGAYVPPGGGVRLLNDLWRLSGSTWTQMTTTGSVRPVARAGHTAVYDQTSNRMVVFGGQITIGVTQLANDTWILLNANGVGGTPFWRQLTTAAGPPPSRYQQVAAYDTARNRLIIFGGSNGVGGLFNDVWVLSNANGLGGTPTWTQLAPTGTLPSARNGASAVYDPNSNALVVFGGNQSTGTLNDVWVLSNANGLGGTPVWTQLSPLNKLPGARYAHSAVYDVTNNRMIVFGGTSNASYFNDTWVLLNASNTSGAAAWEQLTFTFLPEGRAAHTAVYNPATNKMTIFAGTNQTPLVYGDVLTLSDANGN